jgi:preprotein translocase subunit SecA
LFVRYGLTSLIGSRFVAHRSEAPIDNPVVRAEIARVQRIVDGQNFEIRRTLARYASVLEEQHRQLLERRQALLFNETAPDVWQERPERRAALVAGSSEDAVIRAERAVTLLHIDRAWREHLARCADLREGIHLVRLGGHDPLVKYTREAIEAFATFDDDVDRAVLDSLDCIQVRDGVVDLSPLGLHRPSSTWTYLVNDDPFRNQIGRLLTGVGGATVAIYSAAVLMPLLIAWGLVERLFRKLPGRRADL